MECFVKILTAISNCGPLVTLSNVQGTFCQNKIRVAFQKIKKKVWGATFCHLLILNKSLITYKFQINIIYQSPANSSE